MDGSKQGRINAMKGYKYKKISNLLYNLTVHSLAAMIFSLLFSYSYWLPSPCSSTNHFLLISLPYIWSSFCNPKCLFVVVNVIVIFLVGESRRMSTNTSQVNEIYEEYVERSRRLRRVSALQEKKAEEEKKADAADRVVQVKDEIKEAKVPVKAMERAKDQEVKEKAVQVTHEEEKGKEKEKDEEEEGGLMPAEELNKRVEEFIARVNKQRWIEARLLVCCQA